MAALCAAVALSALPGAQSTDLRDALKSKYVRPPAVPYPAENPWSRDKEILGRTLFFDPRLSGSGWISCATCHNPGLGWSDGLPKAIGAGMKTLGRRTPTILNSAWSDLQFWDGRAESLEAQAAGPITASTEMNQDPEVLAAKLQCMEGYRNLFSRAFPNEKISFDAAARAIATFERTLVSERAPFDEWVAGNERAVSDAAKHGFDLFNGKAGCARCHSGWNFSDNSFHDVGLAGDDLGRGVLLPLESQQHAFKTPGLRNIDRRAPYMHDGSESSLEKVIAFYDRGGDVQRPSLSPEIKPLRLMESEKQALLAFLKTLSGKDPVIVYPTLPR
jgi:cytochrome c peroxidase